MPTVGRGGLIERAMKTIKALQSPISISQLAEILELNYSSARYYLQAASLHFPVTEIRRTIYGRLRTLYYIDNNL